MIRSVERPDITSLMSEVRFGFVSLRALSFAIALSIVAFFFAVSVLKVESSFAEKSETIFVACGLRVDFPHSPLNNAHSSQIVPFGSLQLEYSPPFVSFWIEAVPPSFAQFTEAGFAIPIVGVTAVACMVSLFANVIGAKIARIIAIAEIENNLFFIKKELEK